MPYEVLTTFHEIAKHYLHIKLLSPGCIIKELALHRFLLPIIHPAELNDLALGTRIIK